MLATVVVVVFTSNLALGVLVGVLLSGIFFAWKVGQIVTIRSTASADGREREYTITGQIFFASAETFASAFDHDEVLERVRIDVSHSHFWDISAVAALDKVVMRFRRAGTEVDVIGLNEASSTIVDRLAIHDKADSIDLMPTH